MIPWISITVEGWPGCFICIKSYLGETRRYYGFTKKQAERRYREEFGLVGKRLKRLNIF